MANANDVDAAANAANVPGGLPEPEPMDIDPVLVNMLKGVAIKAGLTADIVREATNRAPGEAVTTGDLGLLGQLLMQKVFTKDVLLEARRLEQEEDTQRRRAEMAAENDYSEEYNELYNELYPLDKCVPTDNRYMGKQISSVASKMREKRQAGGFKMDTPADWIRTRKELEGIFRDYRLGGNEMAKVWLAFEVASPSARVTLKDLDIIKDLRANPELANYNEHFVKPQNQCFKVMSAGAHARDSLYRRKPQQAKTEDIPSWHCRLAAVANEAFGPISKWSREHRGIVTDCFISRSRHPEKLAMYVNKAKLEASSSTTRSDHLEELSRLCGEASVSDQAMHPLDDYHLMPADPATTVTPAVSTAADAGSEQKGKPWHKKSQRRYADRQSRPTEQILFTKRDGKCSTCNQDDEHNHDDCTRDRVCWNCNSTGHSISDCPTAPAKPAKGKGKSYGKKTKKNAVNNVQRQPEPAPSTASDEPVEGLYSSAPSTASSMKNTSSCLAYDFINPANGTHRSVFGLAGIWDSGQLTAHHVVMKTSIFERWFGGELEPYEGDRVEGAGGEPLKPKGVARMKLAISGLTTLPPTPILILVCDNLEPNFLVGRRALTKWKLDVAYRQKKETWKAMDMSVEAMSYQAAEKYNKGLIPGSPLTQEEWDQTRVWFNRNRDPETCYGWNYVPRGKKGGKIQNPPTQKTRVQSVQADRGKAATGRKPAETGSLSFAKPGIPSNASMQLPPKAGNIQGDILFRAASDVVIPPHSIRRVQVNYPAMGNLSGKGKHHFLLDATDKEGNLVNPDDPAEVGALPAVIPLPRGQQAVGNKVSVFMINNTDLHQPVLAHTVVGRGSLTQEQENLADTLSQVGADPHIQRVHGVRAGGGGIYPMPPTNPRLIKIF